MIRLVFSIFLLASITGAAELSEAEKLNRIKEGVAQRKKMRERVLETQGAHSRQYRTPIVGSKKSSTLRSTTKRSACVPKRSLRWQRKKCL